MMPYPFDTDDLSDLTDAQIKAMLDAADLGWMKDDIRRYPKDYVTEIAIARLMRDHPKLFEKPVNPDVKAVREAMALRLQEHEADYTAEQYLAGNLDHSPVFLAALDLYRAAKGGEA